MGHKKNLDVCDMTDNELARVITGNPEAMACDLTDTELRAIVGGPE